MKTLNPAPTKAANIAAGEAARADHQKWEQFLPQKTYEIEQVAVPEQFYPAVNGVPPSTTWRFRDTVNGNVSPIIRANYGEPIVVRNWNRLPRFNLNGGFGINQNDATHLAQRPHRLGDRMAGPVDFTYAGKFKDYHYPNVPRRLCHGTHPVLGDVRGDDELLSGSTITASTSPRPKRLQRPGQHVFVVQRRPEPGHRERVRPASRLPKRRLNYDIPMIFADKVFDPTNGQLFFDRFNLDGILGDKYTVNGKIQPYLNVYKRKYRFRLLNGGPSRFYRFHLSNNQPLHPDLQRRQSLPGPGPDDQRHPHGRGRARGRDRRFHERGARQPHLSPEPSPADQRRGPRRHPRRQRDRRRRHGHRRIR